MMEYRIRKVCLGLLASSECGGYPTVYTVGRDSA